MGIMTNTLAMPKSFAWTHQTVFDRLQEAMQTLAAMPSTGCFPARIKSTMPDPVQRHADWMPQPGSPTFTEELAHLNERIADERHRNRAQPTRDAITRMEEALAWQWKVAHPREWRCLAAWAAGGKTGEVARKYGITGMTVRRWRLSALEQIVGALNGWNSA